jgi:ribonuclease HI
MAIEIHKKRASSMAQKRRFHSADESEDDDDYKSNRCWDFKRQKKAGGCLQTSMTTPTPIQPVTIRITAAGQSATHPAREEEKRVIEKITFHNEENDQQPTINSLDKNKGLQRQKITFGPDPITSPTILQLKNNIKIFTDGGYVEGYRASIGVWLSDGHPNNVSQLLPPFIQDNNIAELQAASEAIKIAIRLGIRRLTVVTDSEHVVKFHDKVTRLSKSKLLKFKQSQLYLAYKNCYDSFARLIENRKTSVNFQQVKGHNGTRGNDEADELASLALRKAGLKK